MKKKKEKQDRIKWKELFGIYKNIKMPWLVFAIIIGFGFAMGWTVVEMSKYEQNIMNGVALSSKLLIPYIILSLGFAVINYLQQYVRDGICVEYIDRNMRKKLWGKLIRIPVKFYDRETPDSLVSRITQDCSNANSLVVETVGLIAEISTLVMSFTALAGYSSKLLMMTGMAGILIILYGIAISNVSYWAKYLTQRYFSPFTSFIAERLKAFELVKASGTEDEEFEAGKRVINDMYKADVAMGLSFTFRASYADLTNLVNTAIVFIGGSVLMKEGIIDTGTIIAYYNLAATALSEVMVFFQAYVNIKGGEGGLAKVVRIIESDSEDLEDGRTIDVPDEDITFENVSFGYNDDAKILNNVNFTIPKRKITAIVGANGEGKTTILKLLERYYDPDEGSVRFGKDNAGEISKKEWRQMFGYTSQKTQLISGTVKDNITYGLDRDVSDEELDVIAARANILELIHGMPDGYNTIIDDGGGNFSGGELQRLNIARAIAKNPEYMLLDEATCNLDPATEHEVQGALENMMKDRTVVIVAHNFNTIKNADNIVVLEHGTVTYQGTQEGAMEKSSFFKEFVEYAAV